MKKGILFKTDIHKCSLQSILEVFDNSLVDTANQSMIVVSFDGKLLKHTILNYCHSGFERFDIDDQLFVLTVERNESTFHS